MTPHLSTPHLAIDEPAIGLPPAYRLADDTGPVVLIAEIQAYRAAENAGVEGQPWLGTPWLGLTQTSSVLEDYTTLRVSDSGYVTRETDAVGLRVHAPILSAGIEIDRAMDLDPNGQGAAVAWGSLRLANEGGALDALATASNADGRDVRLRIGRRTALAHGIWRDPAWAETAELLGAIGAGWTLDDAELTLALRDAGWWLDRPVDGAAYAGSGGLEGGDALEGKRKPRLRGGTSGDPVREIAPVLVDETAGIYQVSDAEGGVVTLYERGLSGGITSAGTVADINAASPSAGTYVVESSARGLFVRLGTFPPAGQITVDAWGKFANGATPSAPAAVALELLRQDLAVPATWIDADSFTGLAAARTAPAGVFLDLDEPLDGWAVLGLLMRSSLARLVPRRNGRLAALPLAAIPAGTVPTGTYTAAQIVACVQRRLSPPLAPPPYRVRVGWGRNHTVQVSDLAPTLSGARRQELAETWRVVTASSAAVSAAWRRPSDPEVVETALTGAAGAQTLRDDLLALWGVAAGRRLYDVTLPLSYALRHDIGECIVIAWPGPLAAGALGRIVGEQIRTADNLATLQVLV